MMTMVLMTRLQRSLSRLLRQLSKEVMSFHAYDTPIEEELEPLQSSNTPNSVSTCTIMVVSF